MPFVLVNYARRSRVLPLISEAIAQYIYDTLASGGGRAELVRNELALQFGCAPSQINYVLTTRFSPERGYRVESRRGGGGYIRILHLPPGARPMAEPRTQVQPVPQFGPPTVTPVPQYPRPSVPVYRPQTQPTPQPRPFVSPQRVEPMPQYHPQQQPRQDAQPHGGGDRPHR